MHGGYRGLRRGCVYNDLRERRGRCPYKHGCCGGAKSASSCAQARNRSVGSKVGDHAAATCSSSGDSNHPKREQKSLETDQTDELPGGHDRYTHNPQHQDFFGTNRCNCNLIRRGVHPEWLGRQRTEPDKRRRNVSTSFQFL